MSVFLVYQVSTKLSVEVEMIMITVCLFV